MSFRQSWTALMLVLLSGFARAQPLGTAIIDQGQLTESGQRANGLYDLQVCLFHAPSSPVQIACAPDFNDVPVADGVFAIALDFGSALFVGQQRFIELRVRPGSSTGAYTTLAPRQLIRATPEALRANVSSAAPWAGLTGVPAGFADNVDNDAGGTVTSVSAGTGLSGGTITSSGTIGIAAGWASCPLTQNGYVRVVSQPAYPKPLSLAAAIGLLREACATRHHAFWPDDASILDDARIDASRIHGPRQLTDVYLLALAQAHGGRFVTFDAGVPLGALRRAAGKHLVVL